MLYQRLLLEADRTSDGALALENMAVAEVPLPGTNTPDIRKQFASSGDACDRVICTVGKWLDDGFVDRHCALINRTTTGGKLYI